MPLSRAISNPNVWLIALVVIAAAMNLVLLGRLPLEDADEATYAMVVREMREAGHYLTLSLTGSPWVDKPPLLFWLMTGSTVLLGENEFALRLPSALFGIAAILLTALIIRQLTRNSEAALFGALVLTFFPLFLSASRNVRLDVPVTAAILGALYCFLKGREKPLGSARGKPAWWLGIGIAIGIGILLKSVIALLAVPLFILFSLIHRDWRWLKSGHFWLGAILGLAVALPWHLYEALTLDGFFARYFGFQIGRAATNILDSQITAGYVLWVFFRHGQPWSSLLIAGAAVWLARLTFHREKLGGFSLVPTPKSLVWGLIAFTLLFGIFLLPVTKLITYFIPSYPFAAIFLGTLYAHTLTEKHKTLIRVVARAALLAAMLLSIREAFFDTRLYVTRESRDEKAIGLLVTSQPDAPIYLYEFPSDQSIQYYSRRPARHVTATSDTELAPPFHLVIPTPLVAENGWLGAFAPLYRGEYLALYKIE